MNEVDTNKGATVTVQSMWGVLQRQIDYASSRSTSYKWEWLGAKPKGPKHDPMSAWMDSYRGSIATLVASQNPGSQWDQVILHKSTSKRVAICPPWPQCRVPTCFHLVLVVVYGYGSYALSEEVDQKSRYSVHRTQPNLFVIDMRREAERVSLRPSLCSNLNARHSLLANWPPT